MQIKFKANNDQNPNLINIITHPEKEKIWKDIKRAILLNDEELILIHAVNNRKIPVKYQDIISIQSEGRMCNVTLQNGEMLLLGTRLSHFDKENTRKHIIKINNGVMINMQHIKSFRSSDNARIEVMMQDGSKYFVNRFYIKQFKENLS